MEEVCLKPPLALGYRRDERLPYHKGNYQWGDARPLFGK